MTRIEAAGIINAIKCSMVTTLKEHEALTMAECVLFESEPKNVFVIENSRILSADDLEHEKREIYSGILNGCVILPPWLTLKAVTGPCTDVEVKIINRGEQ